jgi:hypothetical protein
VKGDAKFSACGRWRWWLTRTWDESLPTACMIGMNPSTATASEDDPTIAKEIQYVRSWGFGRLLMLNAFAYKATLPADLYAARARGVNIIGAENSSSHMLILLRDFDVQKTVACWGRLKRDRGWILWDEFNLYGVQLDCDEKKADQESL